MIQPTLSRREREVMDIVYRLGSASGREVQEQLAGSPSYSTVRTLLRILEGKGHLNHVVVGQTFVYRPRITKHHARRQALGHLVSTFFEGSREQLVAALLDGGNPPDREELDQIAELIEQARRKNL